MERAKQHPIQTEPMDRFLKALSRVMKVSKEDMKRLQSNEEAMEWVKEKRGPKTGLGPKSQTSRF